MKPFNLELAKAGHPVCTRDGKEIRIICFDRCKPNFPILALIKCDGIEEIISYAIDGKYLFNGKSTEYDLMMATEKKEGWINIYKRDGEDWRKIGYTYSTKEEAIKNIDDCSYDYVTTIKIEWEE